MKRLRSVFGWGYHWGCGGKVYVGSMDYNLCALCDQYGIDSYDIAWHPKNVKVMPVEVSE